LRVRAASLLAAEAEAPRGVQRNEAGTGDDGTHEGAPDDGNLLHD
jgi:hypothetical protein